MIILNAVYRGGPGHLFSKNMMDLDCVEHGTDVNRDYFESCCSKVEERNGDTGDDRVGPANAAAGYGSVGPADDANTGTVVLGMVWLLVVVVWMFKGRGKKW